MDASAADAGLQSLYGHLDALEVALHTGEIATAALALDIFDAALRAWLPTASPSPRAEVLEALLSRQEALLSCMHDKQAEATAALRILEQSRRAAGAYQTSATGPHP